MELLPFENDEMLVQSRRCQAVEFIEGQRILISTEESVDEGTMDKFCISECESGPALLFRIEVGENGKMSIRDIRSDFAFEDQPVFIPCSLFNFGKLCLGYENDIKVVRRVQDWSLVTQLETDPNDTCLESDKAERVWACISSDSDALLCIHKRGDRAGEIQVWDSTANTRKGTIWHPGISTWTNLPGSGSKKLLTADKTGKARIWDMCRLTYDDFPICLGTGLVDIICHGNILECIAEGDDGQYNTTYHHLRNESLPPMLQGTSTDPNFWVTFSDGTYVLGVLGNSRREGSVARPCHFSIFAPGGIEQGSFEQDSMRAIITFMDRYIVTVAFAGDLTIWNKQGTQFFTTHLGYSNPVLVEGKIGCLVAVEFSEWSAYKVKVWQFLAESNNKGEIFESDYSLFTFNV